MDQALQREQTKDRVKRYRERQKSVTSESVTQQGVTLSDGQTWYPNNYGYHPKECQCNTHDDRTWMTGTEYLGMITP